MSYRPQGRSQDWSGGGGPKVANVSEHLLPYTVHQISMLSCYCEGGTPKIRHCMGLHVSGNKNVFDTNCVLRNVLTYLGIQWCHDAGLCLISRGISGRLPEYSRDAAERVPLSTRGFICAEGVVGARFSLLWALSTRGRPRHVARC